MTYRLARRARADVLDIWRYIASDSEDAADRLIDLLTRRFRVLGENPYAGRLREDLGPGHRSFAVGEYVILYRVADPGVQILHVLHGRRDIKTLL